MDSAVTINNYLPQEILLKIFRYCSLKDLLNFRIVSKHWFELSRDNSLFRNVVFTNDLDTYEIYLIMKLMNSTCPLILKIFCRRDDTVDLFDSITTFLLSRLMKWKKQKLSELNNKLPLYYLYFDNCILGDCLSKLGCRCVLRTNNNKVSPVSSMEKFICSKNLKTTIKIQNCCTATIYSLLITFNFNEELFPKYVETLVISDISILCGSCCICDELNDMVSKCYNLVEFKFKNPKLRESCRKSIRNIYQNLCRYNKITILKISALYLTDDDIKLTENLQDLKVLHLYSARQITRESLIALQNLKHIVSFIISENLLIQPVEWREFFRNTPYMKAVERLGLDECLIDNSVIYRICEACKQLKKFSLNGCRDDTCILTSESLITLFNACTELKKVKLCYVDRELKMAVDDSSATNIDVDFIPIN